MKWLRKWSYLILLLTVGIIYLTRVDNWQVYEEVINPVKEWYSDNRDEYQVLITLEDWLHSVAENGRTLVSNLGVADILEEIGETVDKGLKKVLSMGEGLLLQLKELAMGDLPTQEGEALAGDMPTQEGEALAGDLPTQEGEALAGDLPTQEGEALAGDLPTQEGETFAGDLPTQGAETFTGELPLQAPQQSEAVIEEVIVQEENKADAGNHQMIGNGGRLDTGLEIVFGVEEKSAPKYNTVTDFYFSDAVFIGDSRTVGMFEYGGLEEITTFYAAKGLTIYDVFKEKIVTVPGQRKKITAEEALEQKKFSKIYLMLGINELGTGNAESFGEKYEEVLNRLQELQPDAIIYIQAIIKVTTERSEKGDYITNQGIEERNQVIRQLADNEKIFYLDVNPLICDETGGMVSDYTFDGVHLKAKYIEIWKQFLKEHAILP